MRPYVLTVIFIAQMSHGYKVTQSVFQNIYPNQSAIIVCEHSAQSGKVEDFRLNSVSGTKTTILCQKGSSNCGNIFYYEGPLNKVVFLLLNIGEEAMQVSYQCEFTLEINDLFLTETGEPIKLQPVQKEMRRQSTMPPPPLSPPPPPHLKSEAPLVMWILIGLLVLMLLYSGFVTCCYIRLMRSNQDGENPTYVEMRKVPLSQNNIYYN